MKKILLGVLFFGLQTLPVKAGEFVYEYSADVGAFYGYTDYGKDATPKHKHHHSPSFLEAYSFVGYEFDQDSLLKLNADAQIGGGKNVEDYNHGDWGENIYATFQSKYGEFNVGQVYNAAYQLAVGAPSVGVFKANNSAIVDYLQNPNWQRNKKTTLFRTLNSTYLNTDGDAFKLSYTTPQYYGTNLAFSYTPDSYSKAGLINKHSRYENKSSYSAGLYNTHDWGYFETESSLGYAYNHKNNQEISAGLSFYRKGWTIGGSYRQTFTNGNDYALNLPFANEQNPFYYDGFRRAKAYNVGISYEIGPLTTGLIYFGSKAEKTANKDNIITFANRFAFNKYVSAYVVGAWGEFKGDKLLEEHNRGTAVVCGIELNI